MTKTITTYLLQLTFLSSIITLALGINYISAATWVGPTALPPGSNTAAPLNVGTTNQVKDANLSVGHSTNIATDYGLVSYGRVRSTIGGFEFPDGSVQTTAAASTPAVTTGTFGGSATVTLPGTFTVVEIKGMNGAPNGSSTNVLTVFFATVYNSAGTWKYVTLLGGAGSAYVSTSGTLSAGVQVCPIATGSAYNVQFCLTRTAGGSLQINTGAATSQGAAYTYTMQ